jgi:hypothetical protein
MRTYLSLAVVLAACAAPSKSTPLSELSQTYGNTQVEVIAKSQLAIELHVSPIHGDCPELRPEATATFDGMPMHVERGGYATTQEGGCYPIAFWFDPFPQASLAAFERTTTSSTLVIADRSAHWAIEAGHLVATTFVDDKVAGRITWQDVTHITNASVAPAVPFTISGNTLSYPPGTDISSIDAFAHPVPTRCDGPATCTIYLEGTHAWGPINP